MIGNADDARFIREWTDREKDEYGDVRGAPEGWTRLGNGCYRIAFLHEASGVVYKVQFNYRYSGQSNAHEVATIRRYYLKKLPEGCRLPRYGWFEESGVIAMERFTKLLKNYSSYEREGSVYWGRLRRLQDFLRDVYDLHGANIAVDERTKEIVPIDLGG